jgi:Ca-activated chloride channel family protein
MTFGSPGWLALLVVVPVVAAVYLRHQRRRARYAVRFTDLALLDLAIPHRPGWRRHASAALFLAGLAAAMLSLARPAVTVTDTREQATVVLAIDVSPSMQATDVEPNRLVAATDAARDFVESLPDGFRVGLTAFAGTASVRVPVTTEHGLVTTALDELDYASRTAIAVSLAAIDDATDVGDGAAPGHVLLLSDGESTSGLPVDEAVDLAQGTSVPVTTIAFGTDKGTVELQGEIQQVPPDRATMRSVAEQTGGQFFEAESGIELGDAYSAIRTRLAELSREEPLTEETVVVAVGLLLAAGLSSTTWFGRLP